jgi:hypothetical protein
MAVDATAAQWSYQFAYEGFFNYKDDILESTGEPRPEGRKGFFQFRMVAPIPKTEKWPITLLPRLTLRAQQAPDGSFGFGSSDIFVLGIVNQWSTGRWGIGPQINFPASSSKYGNPNWGVGFAAAVTQRALEDKLFLAFLVQQAWSDGKAGTLGLNLIIVYQLGNGWYVGNGDYVISYNWQTDGWYIPVGLRLGKAFINEKRTINVYGEWAASATWPGWEGPVASQSFRVNIQWQIPVKF